MAFNRNVAGSLGLGTFETYQEPVHAQRSKSAHVIEVCKDLNIRLLLFKRTLDAPDFVRARISWRNYFSLGYSSEDFTQRAFSHS